MIPYIRSVQYQMSAEPVAILIEVHANDAAYLDPARRPLGSFYANTTQGELAALVVAPATEWGDVEVLQVAQPAVDDHPDWGGMGLTVQLAPVPVE